jgi:hypothetical protein
MPNLRLALHCLPLCAGKMNSLHAACHLLHTHHHTTSHSEDALAYLTWTYLFRRLVQNPSYYQLEDTTPAGVTAYLQGLVGASLDELCESGCVEVRKHATCMCMRHRSPETIGPFAMARCP